MLILNRRTDEVIMIGDDIEVMVVEVRGKNSVRLGIKAPLGIEVHRKEVYDKIKRGESRDSRPATDRTESD